MIKVNIVDRLLSELDALLDENPDLEPAVDFYEELLPVLYAAIPALDGLTLHMESAQLKLKEGVPLLWGEFMAPQGKNSSGNGTGNGTEGHSLTDSAPGVEPNIDLLMTLCRLAADGGVEDGERILKSYLDGKLDLHQLMDSAVMQDHAALSASARRLNVDPQLLTSTLNLLLTPICRAYHVAFSAALDFGEWREGYCPVCGDWPILGELRGSERARYLRCGRCTAAWKFSRLSCHWCNNTERDELGFLFDPDVETWRVDTCDYCKGYSKTKTTFEPLDGDLLVSQDLKTMALDLAADQQGYKRPQLQPGLEKKLAG